MIFITSRNPKFHIFAHVSNFHMYNMFIKTYTTGQYSHYNKLTRTGHFACWYIHILCAHQNIPILLTAKFMWLQDTKLKHAKWIYISLYQWQSQMSHKIYKSLCSKVLFSTEIYNKLKVYWSKLLKVLFNLLSQFLFC